MIKSEYFVIGCMSGTSLDGLDLAYIKYNLDTNWKFEIIVAETIPYSKAWKQKLIELVAINESDLKQLDNEYTSLLAAEINMFIKKNNIITIDAISSHGHTALHQPEKGITFQIGNLKDLSILTKNKVVCDFRKQDVEYGGQGAPLVPIGDKLLFSEFDYCLNLGGFANISFENTSNRVAFDICPINIVLNHYAGELGYEYDVDGKIASQGKINNKLLNDLNALSFYKQPFPKSLGIEWVKDTIFPLINSYNISVDDILRTFIEHVTFQIVSVFKETQKTSVLVTGGGAYNAFLIKQLKQKTSCEIVIPSKPIIEYKEAVIFGLLGILKLRNETNCLASVTGAKKNHSSGVIFYNSIEM